MTNEQRTINYWLEGSAENFAKAERDFKARDFVYALFWLHLAAEKLLKAAFVKMKARSAPYTHELLYLAHQMPIKGLGPFENFLEELTVFQLEARYPEDFAQAKERATGTKAKELFEAFDNFQKWLKPKINLD